MFKQSVTNTELGSEQRDLVLACTLGGEEAVSAFDRFLGGRDPDELSHEDRQLLPFVYRTISSHDVDHAHRAALKRHYVGTWTTNQVLLRRAQPCLSWLEETGEPGVLLKGAAMATDEFYGDLGIRQMADIDILMTPDRLGPFIDWALDHGWNTIWGRSSVPQILAVSHAVGLHDDAGGELDAHQSVLGRDRSSDLDRALIESCMATTLGNATVHVPQPHYMLMHSLCHANPNGLRNIVDAIHLITSETHPPAWDLVVDEIIARRSVLGARQTLSHIQEVRPEIVPAEVSDRLASTNTHWSDLAHTDDDKNVVEVARFTLARLSQVTRGSGPVDTLRTAVMMLRLGVRDVMADRRDTGVSP